MTTQEMAHLVLTGLTTIVAIIALWLSVLNYRAGKKRDGFSVTSSLYSRTNGSQDQPQLLDVQCDVVNVGQRPVVVFDAVLRFRGQRSLRHPLGRPYHVYHSGISFDGLRLIESTPRHLRWKWSKIQDAFDGVSLQKPRLVGVYLILGVGRRVRLKPSNTSRVQNHLRELRAGKIKVDRTTKEADRYPMR